MKVIILINSMSSCLLLMLIKTDKMLNWFSL